MALRRPPRVRFPRATGMMAGRRSLTWLACSVSGVPLPLCVAPKIRKLPEPWTHGSVVLPKQSGSMPKSCWSEARTVLLL